VLTEVVARRRCKKWPLVATESLEALLLVFNVLW